MFRILPILKVYFFCYSVVSEKAGVNGGGGGLKLPLLQGRVKLMTRSNNSSSGSTPQSAGTPHPHSSCAHFQSVLRRNWHSGSGGIYAVCSAHPQVIHAAIQQSIADDSVLHVESELVRSFVPD